jgi:DedD protein
MAKRARELQFATHQLVGVFLGLIGLCAFVFLLGISMGSKKTALTAKSGEKAKTETPSGAIQAELEAHARNAADPGTEAPRSGAAALKPGPETKPAQPEVKSGIKTPADKPASKPTEKPADKPAGEIGDKPAVKTSAEAEAKKTPATGSWFVQVAAVDEKPAAETVARKLEKDGFPALVIDPLARDKKTVYRVRVGPFPSKAEADKAKAKLAEASKRKTTDYFLVKG